jgi:hypothetical protein
MKPHCAWRPSEAEKLRRWTYCKAERASGAAILTFDLMLGAGVEKQLRRDRQGRQKAEEGEVRINTRCGCGWLFVFDRVT